MKRTRRKSVKEIRRDKLQNRFAKVKQPLIRALLDEIYDVLHDLELDFLGYRRLPATNRRSRWSIAFTLGLARGRYQAIGKMAYALLQTSDKQRWIRQQLSRLRREFPLPQLRRGRFKDDHPLNEPLKIYNK